MTVVNAIRFDDFSGAMVCDEQVSWGDMARKGDVGDKIQSIVPATLTEKFGLVAAYGGSGTSSVSEEIKNMAFQFLRDEEESRQKYPARSGKFLTVQQVADRIFGSICEMKRRHVDEYLFHRFGFKGIDLIRGYYETKGGKVDINQKEIIDEAHSAMTWKGGFADLKFLFVNRGIMAGYEQQEGFRIFYFNMMTFSYEPVQAVFQSIGSGQDMSDFAFADFVGTKTVQERREHMDPIDAMVSIIHATNLASANNIGVGGYFNIVVIDGRKPHGERLKEIADEHAKLASETVAAYKAELIPKKLAFETIGELVFNGSAFEKVEKNLFRKSHNEKALSRFLRGYKP